VPADLAMERRRRHAELEHVTQHGHARPLPGHLAQVVESGLHRQRVGVVGVVQQQAAPGQLLEPSAQRRELDAARPRFGLFEIVAERNEGADGRQGVLQIVPAAEAEIEGGPAPEGVDQRMRRAALDPRLGHTHVGALAAERDETARVIAQMGFEQGFVGGHDKGAPAHLGDDLGLGGGDLLDGAHELEVDGSDVGDDADVGLDDRGQLGDLTASAHGKLADEHLGGRLELEHGQRHADLVVVVAARRHDPRERREKGGEDVFGRGLADAAGDRHDPGGGTAPYGGGQAAQRALTVVDYDARRAGAHRGRGPLRDHCGDGAGGQRGAGEVAAVEARAAQRYEQVAGRGRPVVDGDARGDGPRIAGLEAAVTGGRRLCERQRDHRPPASPADPPPALPAGRVAADGCATGRPSAEAKPSSASSAAATSRSSKWIVSGPRI
jgi:hypothetical protein